MKLARFLFLGMAAMLVSPAWPNCGHAGEEAGPGIRNDAIPDSQDVLAQALESNSEKRAAPPRGFRSGNVQPRSLPRDAARRNEHGFTVSFPSGAPIPTPTVYDGKLY